MAFHRIPGRHQRAGRLALWLTGGTTALITVLAINGTLSSWTAAIIHNDTNTAGATDAVALAESADGGTTTCVDTATVTDGSNTATCTTINKYGGDTAMAPGSSKVVDVTFTNTGNGDGVAFGYAPGTCSDAGGTLCSNGDLTVAVSCSPGTTYAAGSALAALANAAAAPGDLADTTGASVPLVSGGTLTCRFTTTLDADAPASNGGASVSQPITWTLSAV